MAVANVTVSGVKTYKSAVARMAAASGDQVARYFSEFFAKQGWIRPEPDAQGEEWFTDASDECE